MKIEALDSFEKDVLLRKLLHHMGQDVRGRIMAEYPVMYAKMAPHTTATVMRKVADAIEPIAEEVAS